MVDLMRVGSRVLGLLLVPTDPAKKGSELVKELLKGMPVMGTDEAELYPLSQS
jgi:hypothetical protein